MLMKLTTQSTQSSIKNVDAKGTLGIVLARSEAEIIEFLVLRLGLRLLVHENWPDSLLSLSLSVSVLFCPDFLPDRAGS